jgi:uncharacterized protein (TIGR02145 family)
MKREIMLCMLTLCMLSVSNIHSQVTIGALVQPAKGALLDLNSVAKGGLLLSNVRLTDLRTIPPNFPSVVEPVSDAVKAQLRGAIVYNTGTENIPAGVYIWNSRKWIPSIGDPDVIYDIEKNAYYTGNFGAAGVWMTQNLRSTKYADGTPLTVGCAKNSDDDRITAKFYTYPRPNDKEPINATYEANKQYGLLYSWAAATGRVATSDNESQETDKGQAQNQHPIQGICPDGWHLPCDYEWSALEQEIATHPAKYSTQTVSYENTNYKFFNNVINYRPGDGANGIDTTYWGRQMKSHTPVVNTEVYGSSRPYDDGGFDVLLIGCITGGDISSYGTLSAIWSSSSHDASYAYYRTLTRNYTGMARSYTLKHYLFSVRCKKN